MLSGFDIFKMEGGSLYQLILKNHGLDVGMGKIGPVTSNAVIGSTGGNPCLVAVISKHSGLFVLHSWGRELEKDQLELIKGASDGLALASLRMPENIGNLLKDNKIKIISAPNEEVESNIAVVNSRITEVPHGIFFGFNIPSII
jgi:hypothetical protein